MRRSDFTYELPPELIAQRPAAQRTGSRLLRVDPHADELSDLQFADFPKLLRPNDLLVFNDTRVIPARVLGAKPTGGQVEILLERILGPRRILAHVHASKALRHEVPILLADGVEAHFIGRHDDLFELELNVDPLTFFERHGSMPLPPYIERAAETEDASRYQTVYAREAGAVAAPTAGLHFDEAMLERCRTLGVRMAYVTLHVGAGTFQSIRVDDLDQHKMHRERVIVTREVCDAILETRAQGGRVVAVGTTVVRSLESASASGEIAPFDGETQLFIRPGYRRG